MKTKKRTAVLLILCVAATLLLLSGCGAAKPSEAVLQNDLLSSDEIKFYEISEFEEFVIDKSDTSEDGKDYTVFVSLSAVSDSGAYRLAGEYTMEYHLYDEGWMLEEINVASEDTGIVPLVGANFTEDELLEALGVQGYTGLTNLSVYDQKTDLDSGTDVYFLTADEVHTYVTYHWDLAVNCTFDSVTGVWTLTNSWVGENNPAEEEWNLAGKTFSDGEYSFEVSYFDGDVMEFILSYGEGDTYEEEYIYAPVVNQSIEDYLLDIFGKKSVDNIQVRQWKLNYGYRLRIKDVNEKDIFYIIPIKRSIGPTSMWNSDETELLIGPEYIYRHISWDRYSLINDVDRTLDFYVTREVYPIDSELDS